MFPFCDYSKITELAELKRAQDEELERLRADLAEREEALRSLEGEIGRREEALRESEARAERLAAEKDKWEKTSAYLKQEAEARIAKLNGRIRELTGAAPAAGPPAATGPAPKSGLFRK